MTVSVLVTVSVSVSVSVLVIQCSILIINHFIGWLFTLVIHNVLGSMRRSRAWVMLLFPAPVPSERGKEEEGE